MIDRKKDMFARYKKNFITEDIIKLINKLNNLIQHSDSIKLSLTAKISCSQNSSEDSSISSNEIEGITK